MSTALDIEVVGAGEREREIRAAALAAARAARVGDGHLAVSVVGEPEIARLNREHRGRDTPTDVLSFPVDGSEPAAGPRELGDVVVCPERCEDVAEAVVHGVLHLCGHDHEADSGEMLELQDRVMGEVREEAAAVDPEGARLARRMVRALNGIAVFGNGFGAVTVFAFIAFLAPVSVPQDEYDRLLVRSTIVFVPFMGLTLLIGRRWAYRRFTDPVRDWLRSGRPATDAERRLVVRQPLEFAVSAGLFWVLAAVVFTLINLGSSAGAQSIGLTVLLGAFTSCSVQYLLVERALRPVAERAMAGAPPPAAAVPGVATRVLMSWLLATGVPLFALVGYAISDLSGGDDALAAIVFLGFVALVLGLLAILVAARSVADPVGSVRRALERVEQGDLATRVPVDDASEVGMLQVGFNRMAAGLEERERLRDLFGRHVGEEVARAALGSEAALGGEVRDVAALFVDLVGSTALAAERPPDEVVSLLNDFFRIVVEVTAEHGGFVNKFEGDAALCVFGAPVEREDYAGEALRAARELRERLARELPHIDVGIGLAAGPAVAGNIGSEQRFEYTVIGDPVNEAARLCELAKMRPERVLASEAALERAGEGEAGHWELGEEVQLRGRRAATRLASPRAPERA